MNERIKELAVNAGVIAAEYNGFDRTTLTPAQQKFAELIVAKVLDEVAERAYYCGDRAWSDELDRPWIELEFGLGELAGLKK